MKKIDVYKVFDELAKEAATGESKAFFRHKILFETILNDGILYKKDSSKEEYLSPVLKINDLTTFLSLTEEYLDKVWSLYNANNYYLYVPDEVIAKELLIVLWANATYEDFLNPNEYLKRRIDFLENKIPNEEKIINSLNSKLIININKSKINLETPYCMKLAFTNGEDDYQLPNIYFGISGNKAYVYAIKYDSKEDSLKDLRKCSDYRKFINRFLYKIGTGFSSEYDGVEDEKNVTSSFVVALNIFMGVMKKNGINDIVATGFLPIRYLEKELLFDDSKGKDEKYSEEVVDHDQENMTNKFFRTFRRVALHHTGINITGLPLDVDSNLYMHIDDEDVCNNPLLEEAFDFSNSRKI